MASLAQIATKIKTLAVAKAPIKTGNLKKKLDTYNRPVGMIKERKTTKGKSITFVLDVSPPGAEYGKFWNEPNLAKRVENGKTKNIPGSINFANKAINDAEVQRMIDEYVNQTADEITNQLRKSLNTLD
jgi:hypothetical protein